MPTHETTTRTRGSGTSWSAGLGSPSEGELMLMMVGVQNGGSTLSFTTPAGWTLEASDVGLNFQMSRALYSKVAGASESDPTIVQSGTGTSGAIVVVVSDHDGINVDDWAFANSGDTVDAPSIAAASGDLIIEMAIGIGFVSGGQNWTIPTDNSEVQPTQGGDAADNNFGAESAYFTASGTTTAATWTLSGASQRMLAATIAVAPAAASSATLPLIIQYYG